ncbi:hypothetical protein K435DRAFT_871653 [Dendrothele bispora CBS 962.96]|uniref:Uncharacterized protein n=1 Tax=Dendrothele bispora (strain CBS 962.96) TaxID=1314807 RepID=A0A4S8L3K8_DENBC|nr:hypothetical protein K435DRAFT_871653 [Dendrothele bispora CBS 962.96]
MSSNAAAILIILEDRSSRRFMSSDNEVKYCPTPEELDKNHNLLLHRQKQGRPTFAHDAITAAVLPGGRFFITTPYHSLPIYKTAPTINDMRMRRDFRFAEHDYSQWPQFWHIPLCHLACIRRRPAPDHPHSIMWWVPTKESFSEERRGIAVGLGKLELSRVMEIRKVVRELRERCQDFVDSHANTEEVELARRYSRGLGDRTNRLDVLLLSFRQVCYAVASVQRLWLELYALLDYCQVYKPRMNDSVNSPSLSSPDNLLGAFVWDINHAELLFRARIPFWYIHDVNDVPKVSVEKLAPLVSFTSVCQSDSSFVEPVIFRGVPNVQAQYTAINNHLAAIFDTHCPFESSRQSRLDIATSSNLVLAGPNRRTSAANNSRSSPYRKKTSQPKNSGRDKFSLPNHKFFPPSSPCWVTALARVDRSSPPDPVQGGYAFPDPALIVTVAKHEKTMTYCRNWLRFRDILIFRLSRPSPRLIPNSTWHQLLNGDFKTGEMVATGSRTAAQKTSVTDLLGNCLLTMGVDVDLDEIPDVVSWRNQSFSVNSDLPDVVVKEIVWELSHLNFRCELSALDRVLTPTSLSTEESDKHAQRLRDCFFGADASNLLAMDFDQVREGFAAEVPVARKSSLFALRDVMMVWPYFKERCRDVKDLREGDFYNDTKLETFELVVISGYLQYFFDTFGRAAITPLRLDT